MKTFLTQFYYLSYYKLLNYWACYLNVLLETMEKYWTLRAYVIPELVSDVAH